MIKINLLPRIIDHKRALRNTALLFAFLLAVVVGGGVAYGVKLKGDVARMDQMATAAEQWEARVKGLQQQATQMRDSIKPIQQKLDFINQVLDYNLQYPKLYEEIARWTYDKVTLFSLACDGTQVKMVARAKSLEDVGRYLLNMYRATDLFTEVTISGIPSYRTLQGRGSSSGSMGGFEAPGEMMMGGQIGGSQAGLAGLGAIESGVSRTPIDVMKGSGVVFEVTAKLKKPIAEPAFGGAASQPGATGAPGEMMPMGQPGMAPGGAAPPPM